AMRSRIPPRVARELDRLSRRAHRFHRFAHHPLCGRYRSEVIALGRKNRICRGCTLAFAGASLGVAVGFALPVAASTLPGLFGLLLAAWLFAFAVERARAARASKLLTRALPLFAWSLAFVVGLRDGHLLGVGCALSALAALGYAYYRYRARGPNRKAC